MGDHLHPVRLRAFGSRRPAGRSNSAGNNYLPGVYDAPAENCPGIRSDCAHTQTHTHTHAYTHTYTHTDTYTHTQIVGRGVVEGRGGGVVGESWGIVDGS